MYRHNPQTTRLRQLVREGAIGELRVVRSCFSYSLHDSENIRLRTDVEGGSLMDVGCYCVSGSRLLAGEPEQVYGAQFVGSSGTDWVFSGTMRFPGDVLAQFDCGTALPERDELEAIGSDGALFLDDPCLAAKASSEYSSWSERELSRCRERIDALSQSSLDCGALRLEAIRYLKHTIGFDRWCWPLADPETLVTSSGLAEHNFGPSVARSLQLEYSEDAFAAKHELSEGRRAGYSSWKRR